MEALGVVANIAAVIQLAAQVTQLSYSYVREVKNAPKIQKKYLQEVSALMDVLFRVEQVIVEAESTGLLPPRPTSLDDETLMDCYKQLSRLHFELQKRKSRFLVPFQDKELRPHIEMLHKFRENFSDYLSACILVTTNATYKKVSSLRNEQDRNMLLAWVPPVEIQIREKPAPSPGTGMWFLSNPSVRNWINGSSQLLWCHGPPGVGKSFLASIVIDSLTNQDSSDALVVYFFCDFSSQNEHTAVNILRWILRKLVEQGNTKALAAVKELLEEANIQQNVGDITRLITKAGSAQQIYLVLDAVDEMKSPNELLGCCLDLRRSNIQVLVMSRNLPHIQKKMSTASQLEITGNTTDLKHYIESRLRESDFEDLAEDEAMIDNIISKCGNLFLLARLTLDEVLDLTTVGQLRNTLKRQPLGLKQMFESTLQRIDGQSKARKLLARRLISWILYAKRRLKLEEVVTAFAVDEEGIENENMPAPKILLRICVGMVVVNQVDNTLGLVHTSAYEYLYTALSAEEAHLDIAQTCLRYFGLNSLMSGPCNSSTELMGLLNTLKFLDYSAKHWGHHICNQASEKQLQPLILRYVRDDKLLNVTFQALQFRQGLEIHLADEIFNSLPGNQHALHVVAYWNLVETANILLEEKVDVTPTDSHKWTPLHWACSNNHFTVANLLVQKGADVNRPDIQGWTPLFWAAFIGDVQLVRLLISNGANHQFRSALGWTALHWAISRGHSSVVKALLEHHSRSGKTEPQLHSMTMDQIKSYAQGAVSAVELAADTDDADLFSLLLQDVETRNGVLGDAKFNVIWESAGFDVPVSENPWRTLTKAEHINGVESMIPRLKDQENLRSNTVDWRSLLLVSAIRDQQLTSAQLLAKTGADPNRFHALHVAAHRRDPRYVKCLLQSGADPTLMDHRERSALHIAIMNGFLETMIALVHGGSDVNQPMFDDGAPIWKREKRNQRQKSTPPLILACGFSIEQQDLSFQMVQILLSKGADPTQSDHTGKNVLHFLLSEPHFQLIKLLIESGAPVDAVDREGRTPLHYLTRCQDSKYEMKDVKEMICLVLTAGEMLCPPRDLLDMATHKPSSSQSSASENLPLRLLRPWRNWFRGRKFKLGFRKAARPVEYLERPEELDEKQTPLSLSLIGGRWKLVRIFSELGAAFPTNLNLSLIINEAIQALEAEVISLLCSQGAQPPPNSVLVLVISFIHQRGEGKLSADALCEKFKQILADLCSVGADVNFSGAVKEESEEESEEETYEKHEEERAEKPLGTTPLTLAVTVPGSRDIFEDLLSHGADIYGKSRETFDPILTAALFGEPEDLSCLLHHSAMCPNQSHWTKYLEETLQQSDPIVRVCVCLRKAGLLDNINMKGQTLLHLAAQRGNIPLLEALLAQKPRRDIVDKDGRLAIDLALNTGSLAPFENGVSISERSQSLAENPSSEPDGRLLTDLKDENGLVVAVKNNDIFKVSTLLQQGRCPDQTFKEWIHIIPVLYHAAQRGYSEIVSLLLDYGADIEAPDNYGWRPLHIACYRGHTDIVRALIAKGADVHVPTVTWNDRDNKPSGLYEDDSWTGHPLHAATMGGHSDIVKILLEHNVDVHVGTGVGTTHLPYPAGGPTALHIALENNVFYGRQGEALDPERLQIAQWLVNAGAMVQGINQRYSLPEILRFEKFPDLWNALVAGDS